MMTQTFAPRRRDTYCAGDSGIVSRKGRIWELFHCLSPRLAFFFHGRGERSLWWMYELWSIDLHPPSWRNSLGPLRHSKPSTSCPDSNMNEQVRGTMDEPQKSNRNTNLVRVLSHTGVFMRYRKLVQPFCRHKRVREAGNTISSHPTRASRWKAQIQSAFVKKPLFDSAGRPRSRSSWRSN